MLKSVLLIISLSFLIGCPSLPKIPAHTQYGIHADVEPPGFYGVHNESRKRIFKTFDDPSMKGGQCVSANDYKAIQAWVKEIKQILENNCGGK